MTTPSATLPTTVLTRDITVLSWPKNIAGRKLLRKIAVIVAALVIFTLYNNWSCHIQHIPYIFREGSDPC